MSAIPANLEVVLQLKILRQEAEELKKKYKDAYSLYNSKLNEIKELEKSLIVENYPEYSY